MARQQAVMTDQERYNRQASYFNNSHHWQRRPKQARKSRAESPYALMQAAFYPPSLRLNENLQICLLALASRYPQHILDINEELLGPQSLGAEGWRASDIIELLQRTAPEMLQARACLEVNTQKKGIYLLENSGETPAFWVHCGECGEKMPLPPYGGNMTARREKLTQRHEEVPVMKVAHSTTRTYQPHP